MYKVVYSENSVKDLRKIEKSVAKRIVKKIHFFSEQKSIFDFSKPLSGLGDGRHRFRIGSYRAIFKIDKSGKIQILMILNIKHRKDIYLK